MFSDEIFLMYMQLLKSGMYSTSKGQTFHYFTDCIVQSCPLQFLLPNFLFIICQTNIPKLKQSTIPVDLDQPLTGAATECSEDDQHKRPCEGEIVGTLRTDCHSHIVTDKKVSSDKPAKGKRKKQQLLSLPVSLPVGS